MNIAPAADLLLGTEPRQRRRAAMVLMTALMYAVCVSLLAYGVLLDYFEREPVALLSALSALTALTFYALIRSGANLRFAEPSLAFPQAMMAQSLIAFGYAISGPAHACTLLLLAMVMFFGMFDMSTRHVRMVVLYTIALMGAVMAWSVRHTPLYYQSHLELIYFTMTATVLPSISTLSVQLSTLRARMRSQKIQLEQALADLRLAATHDELTGLPNRRRMAELLAEHITRHLRDGPEFDICLVDIDHFKHVNDTFGHGVGDEALVAFARHAQAALRSTDVIARWGGEEFLVLLPRSLPGEPDTGIERLRASLGDVMVSTSVPNLRIAFSSGLTRYRAGDSLESVVERADRGLYAAKHAGRNRSVTV